MGGGRGRCLSDDILLNKSCRTRATFLKPIYVEGGRRRVDLQKAAVLDLGP